MLTLYTVRKKCILIFYSRVQACLSTGGIPLVSLWLSASAGWWLTFGNHVWTSCNPWLLAHFLLLEHGSASIRSTIKHVFLGKMCHILMQAHEIATPEYLCCIAEWRYCCNHSNSLFYKHAYRDLTPTQAESCSIASEAVIHILKIYIQPCL